VSEVVAAPDWSARALPPFERSGEGPVLLLLHATLSASAELAALAHRLDGDFSVVRVDRRGSGRNAPPPGSRLAAIDVATHVDDLVRLVEAQDLAPVFVAGHSYGGCLALELAARRPDLVKATWTYEPPYALVGPPEVRDRLGETGRRTLAAYHESGSEAAAEAFLAQVMGPRSVDALSAGARARIRGQGAAAIADAALLGLDAAGLARIRCPVRIVTGTASRPDYASIAEALVRRIPSAQHVRMEGADHMAPVTRTAPVAGSIRELLS
jgi:pimeloyl-ACP methyl ester carboxylesterase